MAKKYSPAAYKRRNAKNRRKANMEALWAAGFIPQEDSLGKMSDKQFNEFAERLLELESKYDVSHGMGEGWWEQRENVNLWYEPINKEPETYWDRFNPTPDKDTYASVSYYPESHSRALTLNSALTQEELEAAHAGAVASGWLFSGGSTATRDVVTHEYGHAVQVHIERAAGIRTAGTQLQAAETARREILNLAKNHGAAGDALRYNMSKYGATNPREFFAEAFVDAHSGKPGPIGKAMKDYLAIMKERGLLGGKR